MDKVVKANNRECWIDNVKLVACILVVVGHFFQSMANADLIVRNQVYQWFMQMIYCFHVPLFFISSGYLYQRYTVVNSFKTWKENTIKKLFGLGVPYFTFSIITYFMKEIFSSSVNSQNGELINSLFFQPISPYWYLYALFFLFIVTPTFVKINHIYAALGIGLVIKLVGITGVELWALPRFMEDILTYEIWFLLGMALSVKAVESIKANNANRNKNCIIATLLIIAFLCISIILFKVGVYNDYIDFACGIMACGAIIMFLANLNISHNISTAASKYTMSIYLMHTIFAAGFRSVLFKIGISNLWVHIIVGLGISFVGPIVATYIMRKTKYLEFFVNPWKVIRLVKSNK